MMNRMFGFSAVPCAAAGTIEPTAAHRVRSRWHGRRAAKAAPRPLRCHQSHSCCCHRFSGAVGTRSHQRRHGADGTGGRRGPRGSPPRVRPVSDGNPRPSWHQQVRPLPVSKCYQRVAVVLANLLELRITNVLPMYLEFPLRKPSYDRGDLRANAPTENRSALGQTLAATVRRKVQHVATCLHSRLAIGDTDLLSMSAQASSIPPQRPLFSPGTVSEPSLKSLDARGMGRATSTHPTRTWSSRAPSTDVKAQLERIIASAGSGRTRAVPACFVSSSRKRFRAAPTASKGSRSRWPSTDETRPSIPSQTRWSGSRRDCCGTISTATTPMKGATTRSAFPFQRAPTFRASPGRTAPGSRPTFRKRLRRLRPRRNRPLPACRATLVDAFSWPQVSPPSPS